MKLNNYARSKAVNKRVSYRSSFLHSDLDRANQACQRHVQTVRCLDEQLAKANKRIAELEGALEIALSDKTLDLVRCGIGGNYGGSCYGEAIHKYHTPLVELSERLRKEQE